MVVWSDTGLSLLLSVAFWRHNANAKC